VLTHTVFYGLALLSLNESQVQNYEFEVPDKAAVIAAQQGQTQIYLIWWVNGRGWYEQPTIQSSFREVYRSGAIAIYNYNMS
jgi:hypothetical protein